MGRGLMFLWVSAGILVDAGNNSVRDWLLKTQLWRTEVCYCVVSAVVTLARIRDRHVGANAFTKHKAASLLLCLAVQIQTPYWSLSGRANNADSEARQRVPIKHSHDPRRKTSSCEHDPPHASQVCLLDVSERLIANKSYKGGSTATLTTHIRRGLTGPWRSSTFHHGQ